ncbi:hypothetical protein ACRWG2_22295, partial [Escherichia coli]|nr:hypothetical protein [Escherichia coli]
QKQKKLIMLPSETMIWQPEFTDKTLSRKPGAVQRAEVIRPFQCQRLPLLNPIKDIATIEKVALSLTNEGRDVR